MRYSLKLRTYLGPALLCLALATTAVLSVVVDRGRDVHAERHGPLVGAIGPVGIRRIQDADDLTGALTDQYFLQWAAASGKFQLAAASGGGGVTSFNTRTGAVTLTTADLASANGLSNVYNVKAYGAVGDGTTDDSTAVQSAINAAQNGGGGIVYFPPATYRINAQLTFPAGSGLGKAVILEGAGADISYNGTPQGGTILDLRATTSPAKIDCRFQGQLEIRNLTFLEGGGSNTGNPFLQTTNTATQIHHCAFYGNPAATQASCTIDAIVLGGTGTSADGSANAPFQGYGGAVCYNAFHRIRRAVYMRTFCNGVPIIGNTVGADCGGTCAIESLGPATNTNNEGCYIAGNLIEISYYTYGIRLQYTQKCQLIGNNFFDDLSSTDEIRVESTCGPNLVIPGDSTLSQPVNDLAGNTTVIGATKPNAVNYFQQQVQFRGLSPTAPAAGAGTERFGAGALPSAASGVNLTAFGNNALHSNTSGHDSAGFGVGCLQSQTTGLYNVAFGVNVLNASVADFSNSGGGYQCLLSCNGGTVNTAWGYQSLRNLTTGSNNAVFGYGGTTLTTGSGNTLAGNYTDVAASNTSNGVGIGYQAVCASNETAWGPNQQYESYYGKDSTSTTVALWRARYGFLSNTHGSYTGKVDLQVTDATADRTFLHAESDGSSPRLYLAVPNSAPTDANLANGQVSVYVDETNNLLKFRVKYSNGTLKTAQLNLN